MPVVMIRLKIVQALIVQLETSPLIMYRVYSQGVSRRMRIKFLGYLPCTIVA